MTALFCTAPDAELAAAFVEVAATRPSSGADAASGFHSMCSDLGRGPIAESLRRSIDRHGRLGLIHLVHGPSTPDRRLDVLDEDDWAASVEEPLWQLIEVLAASRDAGVAALTIVVDPTGLTGAPDATAISSAAEGARALAKSAARAWGTAGPRVGIVCGAPTGGNGSDRDGPPRTGATIRPATLPEPTVADVADAALAVLALPPGVGCTTLVVDGGRTVLP